MAPTAPLDQIAERVERLLLRHAEMQRAQRAMGRQIAALTEERDALRHRLRTARHRLDALIDRLPPDLSALQDASKPRDFE
ncbi:DUF904 domain-containing protein [Xylophilus ampelinus]|nr:DUF904 domain-containing protein [Xylophilus ampelinus]MCS4509914.1 DUF904 domain-containing protein [Xylophilus ampelinus]